MVFRQTRKGLVEVSVPPHAGPQIRVWAEPGKEEQMLALAKRAARICVRGRKRVRLSASSKPRKRKNDIGGSQPVFGVSVDTPSHRPDAMKIGVLFTLSHIRLAKILLDLPPEHVCCLSVVKNRDGTLGFVTKQPKCGESKVNVCAGATPWCWVNIDSLQQQLEKHWAVGDKTVYIYWIG